MQYARAGLVLALAIGTTGCLFEFKSEKIVRQPQTELPGQVDFARVRTEVLAPSCLSCHGQQDDHPLVTYAQVVAESAAIADAVLGRAPTMPKPPARPLSSAQLSLLRAWIGQGMPEQAGTQPSPEPSPEPTGTPLEPTYASIRKNILEPQCLGCHSSGSTVDPDAAAIPMETLEQLLQSPHELVLPGNSAGSKIVVYTSVPDTDPDRMPPPETGKPRLTAEEIQAIRTWIDQGAKP